MQIGYNHYGATKEVETGVRMASDHSHHVNLLSKMLDLETPVFTDNMMDYLLQVRAVFMYERERERESVCVCVCVCAYAVVVVGW